MSQVVYLYTRCRPRAQTSLERKMEHWVKPRTQLSQVRTEALQYSTEQNNIGIPICASCLRTHESSAVLSLTQIYRSASSFFLVLSETETASLVTLSHRAPIECYKIPSLLLPKLFQYFQLNRILYLENLADFSIMLSLKSWTYSQQIRQHCYSMC